MHTDEGLVGLGETFYGAETVETYIHEFVAPRVMNRNPLQIDLLATELVGYLGFRSSSAEVRGNSAFDIALWDIFGKATGQPVYSLLGGKRQEQIKLFKVISRTDPDVMAAKVAEYHELGFLQVVDLPSPEYLKAYYEDSYYQSESGNFRKSYSDQERGLLRAKIAQKSECVFKLRQSQLLHLSVNLGLFVCKFDITTRVNLLRKIKAVSF